MTTMFYIPNSIDGFYNNLHRIRRDLNAILSGEIEWDSNNVTATPLECEDNVMELNNFQAALSPDEYTIEDYDALCTRIEQLQNEFSELKEEICIASVNHPSTYWWSNCLGLSLDNLTEKLLNNVPTNFIEKNPYTYTGDVTADELIDEFEKFEYRESLLGLACLARNGSEKAHDFLLHKRNLNVKPID